MMYKRTVLCAVCLTFVVVVVGAYVRLQDAGLGCPDWPGCYGHLVGVPEGVNDIERAQQAYPGRPVEAHKAWKEMLHRYLAGTLGTLIFAIMIVACWKRRSLRQSPVLATSIVALVALQAALGMWTVTLLLKPAIVTLHLLGGMSVLALLTWLFLRQLPPRPSDARARGLLPWAAFALAIVACQIALGGWVSANYAALACLDFPTCRGAWLPDADFQHGFQFVRELGMNAAGSPLASEAMIAIQWTHRAGALVTFVVVGLLAIAAARTPGLRRAGVVLGGLLLTQVCLGIANVVLTLPLIVAVAHNAVAAALLVTLVVINSALCRAPVPHQ
jgi:heme a synthase